MGVSAIGGLRRFEINIVENVCKHRGFQVSRARSGNLGINKFDIIRGREQSRTQICLSAGLFSTVFYWSLLTYVDLCPIV